MQMVVPGGARQAPANTKPAIDHAVQDGLEWIAAEVRLSRDGQHVLFGADRVDGLTDGSGLVRELDLSQLQQLDVGKWFAPRFSGIRILTLVDALRIAKGRINFCFELRDADIAKLVEEIRTAGMEQQVLISASDETLRMVREQSQGKIAVLTDWQPGLATDQWTVDTPPEVARVALGDLSADVCSLIHGRGVRVLTVVDDAAATPETWQRLITIGVDLVQTGLPEEAVAHVVHARLAPWPVKIAYHRGATRYAPENTLPAFDKALRMGADYVEFDVRTSSDGVTFLLHDGTLNRTTGEKGPLADRTAAQIEALDAGAWYAPPFRGLKIPRYEAFLEQFGGKIGLYCDAKSIEPELLARTLAERGQLDQTVVYQGVDYLKRLQQIEPRIRAMPPLRDAQGLEALASQIQPFAVDVRWGALSAGLIRRCHELKIQVFSDALGPNERIEAYRQAIEWGIDTIQTDHPLRVIRAIELNHRKDRS